ncbi:hypothetical protein [Nitrosovibrio sp. Nv6]|uniref:hypothetical protein n=1 Tax=Nitrosovibrio sp. Nv6 TaxID=1855340 RepID=UPI0015A6462C|nr:hypothetical protein [Nitrosovibrio sp. Nv6]
MHTRRLHDRHHPTGGYHHYLAPISVDMLLLLIAGWILAYARIFFLDFGVRWTSDMASNYYKTVVEGRGITICAVSPALTRRRGATPSSIQT